MNGQALTRRYEVRDAETGEPVKGAHVLVPGEDEYAWTCMFGYATLCGVEHPQSSALVELDPASPEDRELLGAIAAAAKHPPARDAMPACELVGGSYFAEQSRMGLGGNGTIEYVYNLWRSLGFEPVFVALRAVSEQEEAKAQDWMDGLQERAGDRNLEAQRVAKEEAEKRGLDPGTVTVIVEPLRDGLKPFEVAVFPDRAIATLPDGRGGTVGVVRT